MFFLSLPISIESSQDDRNLPICAQFEHIIRVQSKQHKGIFKENLTLE